MNEAIGPSTWSSKGPTWEPSSTSWVVSVAATIWPVSASLPRCNFRQDRRALVPCFSTSHSPGPHSVRPVLSTSRCTGSAQSPAPALRLDRGRGTSSVTARRLRVVWSGLARSSPRRCMPEPISPSVWRRAKRNTARSVRAVRMARGEYQGCPPRLPTSAAHLGCPPRLPTSAAHLGCPPRLPTSAAHLGCPPRLPTSAAHLGCPPRLPTSAAHLGCPPRLPTSAAHLGCPPRLPTSAAHLGCPPRLPTSAAHLGCPPRLPT